MSEKEKFDKRKYDYQYTKDHYKRIALNLHNSEFEQLQAHISARNENITQFIKRAIFCQIERDSVE